MHDGSPVHTVKIQSFGYQKLAGWGGGEATSPGTEKRCSHNLQSDPLGSGFNKGRENFRCN